MSSIRSPCFSLRVHFHHCRDSISWISLFPCFYYLIRPLRCVGQRVVVGVDSQDAPTRIVGSCHDVMVWWSGPEQKERYGCDYVYSGQSPKRVGVVLQNRIQETKKLKQGYKKNNYESIQSTRVTSTSHRILHARILALDARLHQRGVSEDETRRGAYEPEKYHEWGGEPEEGEADDEEGRVEEFLGDDVGANLDGFRGSCVRMSGAGKEYGEGRTKLIYRSEPAKKESEGDE